MSASFVLAICLAAATVEQTAWAQQSAPINITISKGQFQPAEIHSSAGAPFTLRVENHDSKPVEFSSGALRASALISPNMSETMQVGAMPPGRYTFYDAAHSGTQGVLILK